MQEDLEELVYEMEEIKGIIKSKDEKERTH